jgi:hypothetical protein
MKTFLQFISQKLLGDKLRYNGTPVVVDTHGFHTQEKRLQKKGIKQILDADASKTKSIKKPLQEAASQPPPKKPKNYKHFWQWANCSDNEHLGKDAAEIDAHLEKHYPINDISDHYDSVEMYTTASRHLNRTLLNHYECGQQAPLKVHEHNIAKLDCATGHHKLKNDLHVYSGVGFHPGEKAAQCPHNTIHLPAYTSASICKNTASQFSQALEGKTEQYTHEPVHHVLHVHLKKGQKGLYVGKHSGYDQNEYEFILPRHTTVQVHHKPSIVPAGGPAGNFHKTYVWHAHVVSNQDRVAKKSAKKSAIPVKKKTPAPVKK